VYSRACELLSQRVIPSRFGADDRIRDAARVDDMRPFAAKDRTFKTVRRNQGTATQTVPIPRRSSL